MHLSSTGDRRGVSAGPRLESPHPHSPGSRCLGRAGPLASAAGCWRGQRPKAGGGPPPGPGWAPVHASPGHAGGARCLSSWFLRLCRVTSDKERLSWATRPLPDLSRSRFMPLAVTRPSVRCRAHGHVSRENGKGRHAGSGRPAEAEPRLCPPPPPWLSRGLGGLVQDAPLVPSPVTPGPRTTMWR